MTWMRPRNPVLPRRMAWRLVPPRPITPLIASIGRAKIARAEQGAAVASVAFRLDGAAAEAAPASGP